MRKLRRPGGGAVKVCQDVGLCKDTTCQEWKQQLHRLLMKVPTTEGLGATQALGAVRDFVAEGWRKIQLVRASGDEVLAKLQDFGKTITEMIQLHGPDLPWAPMPTLERAALAIDDVATPDEQHLPGLKNELHEGVPAHTYKFLQHKRGVWTSLQARLSSPLQASPVIVTARSLGQVISEDARADGYANFLAVSEWWSLRTAFTQWFTKNFTSVCQPLAEQMDFSSEQHALHSVVVLSPLVECCRQTMLSTCRENPKPCTPHPPSCRS